MLKKLFQQGRSEVRDAKNNERHVCGRARVGERPVSWARRSLFHPPTRAAVAALSRRYVETLSDARTPLESFCNILKLDVVIEEELVRMRPQTHLINLLAPLITDPCLDQILGKHFPFKEKLVVLF